MDLQPLVTAIADRERPRSEAQVQADIRQLLLHAPLDLCEQDLADVLLESPVGDRRRIDVEVGATVVEVKRDLRKGRIRAMAVEQLTAYVASRQMETGRRYVGLLTDGAEWRCYHLSGSALIEASAFEIRLPNPDVDGFLVWLEGVLATARDLRPTPDEIRTRLGAGSSAHALDLSTLACLYESHGATQPVVMKRQLWARLLSTALGTQFDDSDKLFVEHTLLVNSAAIIAHAVVGLPIETLSPAALVLGSKFAERAVHGVVQPDFFAWLLDVPEGDRFVRALALRLARFDWSAVEHDVLKTLYESVIEADTRKKLGEYYTPDWLAERIVREVVAEPLERRVLDPACGSGTFLFHAVRRYLAAADTAGLPLAQALDGLTAHVIGMDLHPVAVGLARVTYLLAIGRQRLADPTRGSIQVPVYLGDSMQWRRRADDLWSQEQLVIETVDRGETRGGRVDNSLISTQLQSLQSRLRFPEAILADAVAFDELIEQLAAKASARPRGSAVPALGGVFRRFRLPLEVQETLAATFKVLCDLHDKERNHIWGYYVRNLARPRWLARARNRVDCLVGNPPWLAYRHMSPDMQDAFREASTSRRLWRGAKVATHQDLSALFVARTVQLYLRPGGDFGFVMPNAVVDRGQFAGFRKGSFPDKVEPVEVSFRDAWDLRRLRPHFFPRGAAVVFGSRNNRAVPLVGPVQVWSGRLPGANATWAAVEPHVSVHVSTSKVAPTHEQSGYGRRFSQGASFFPRVLFVVERQGLSPLGLPGGREAVRSARSTYENPPWRAIEALEGVVESEFIRPLYVGESVLPYRTWRPSLAVVPWDSAGLLSSQSERAELYPGLLDWWTRAEQVWLAHRRTTRLDLAEQLDYRHKLREQFPIRGTRIVYVKSGMHLCAAIVRDSRAIIDSSLYHAPLTSEDEGFYLCAVLNAATTTRRVRPLMAYGKDERHFDKYVWRLKIPVFDPGVEAQVRLGVLGRAIEREVALLDVHEATHFTARRRAVRKYLDRSPVAREIERLVEILLA